jgi:hypothetical protein
MDVLFGSDRGECAQNKGTTRQPVMMMQFKWLLLPHVMLRGCVGTACANCTGISNNSTRAMINGNGATTFIR